MEMLSIFVFIQSLLVYPSILLLRFAANVFTSPALSFTLFVSLCFTPLPPSFQAFWDDVWGIDRWTRRRRRTELLLLPRWGSAKIPIRLEYIHTHKRQPKQTQTHAHTDIRRFKQRANGQTGVGMRTRLTENGEQCNYTSSTATIGDHNAMVPEGSRPKQQKLQTIQSKSYNTFLAGIYKQVGGQTTGKPSRITRGSLMSWK